MKKQILTLTALVASMLMFSGETFAQAPAGEDAAAPDGECVDQSVVDSLKRQLDAAKISRSEYDRAVKERDDCKRELAKQPAPPPSRSAPPPPPPKPAPPPAPPKPVKLVCGSGTKEVKEHGVTRCECEHPEHTVHVIAKNTGTERREECLPTHAWIHELLGMIQKLEAKPDCGCDAQIKELRDKLDKIQQPGSPGPPVDLSEIRDRIAKIEGRVTDLEKANRNLLDLYGGGGVDVILRGAARLAWGLHATACITGRFVDRVGIGLCGNGGFINGSTTGTVWEAGASLGPVVDLTEDAKHRLMIAIAAEQYGRPEAQGGQAIGNGVGYRVGPEVRYFWQIANTPVVLSPIVGVGFGHVSGWNPETHGLFDESGLKGVQGYLGLDILLTTGIGKK